MILWLLLHPKFGTPSYIFFAIAFVLTCALEADIPEPAENENYVTKHGLRHLIMPLGILQL